MSVADAPKTKQEVDRLLDALETREGKYSSQENDGLLKRLHAATRVANDTVLASLYSPRGLRIVGSYAFQDPPQLEHLSALKCLNNVLVRSEGSRRHFVPEVGPEKIVKLIKQRIPEDELALANILVCACQFPELQLQNAFENLDLAAAVNALIIRNAEEGNLPTAEPTSGSSASLRLLATLGARYGTETRRFSDSVKPVMDMLSRVKIPSPPLEPPVSVLVNCLPVLPLEEMTWISSEAIEKMVEVLKDSLSFYGMNLSVSARQLEYLPLLVSFQKIAQSQAEDAKACLKEYFLPKDEDRKEVLGKGDTLPHKLLSLTDMSSGPDMEVREVIMSTFFLLSDKNPSEFVHNTGFGNAAGYLASQGINLESVQADVNSAPSPDHAINPITGQRLDFEPNVAMPDMTDEEKEREAERLFVLFERLRATGVVDVENPVTQAAREGRIQELSDTDESDEETDKKT